MNEVKNGKKPKVVILGAGFGGIYTFLNIRKQLPASKVDVTIINQTNYFLFTPLLHEVATGGLAHHQVVESIRSITYKKGATLHMAEIVKVDTANKQVQTSVGVVSYDILVIATGASTAFYNIPGSAENSLVLKNLHDAIKMRNRFISAFEQAVETKDLAERKRLLTFVLVGGGATGVELAAEMTELFYDTFKKFFCGQISRDEIKVHLVAGGPELVGNFHKEIREQAKKILINNGVNIVFNLRVKEVDDDGVTLSDGSRLDSEHVLWLAGVKPNVPASDVPFATDKNGRIIVDRNLRMVSSNGISNIYALGDVASFADENLPMHAQMAIQAAPVAAENIVRQIRSEFFGCKPGRAGQRYRVFKYKPVGDLMSLGQWQAVGYFLDTLWTGPLAWFIWRAVYLFKFASWPKRIKIAVDWTIDAFYPRDITKA